MHEKHPTAAATARSFQPFAMACSARNLSAQLDALKQNPFGRTPAQGVDAAAPHYVAGLSKAAAAEGGL